MIVLVAVLAPAGTGQAAENAEAAGPLADYPSEPGPHLEKVRALGPNEWLDLGKPKPDPKYGAAQGRSWSRKMAFAPDLRGAVLYGEGVHGGTSERGGKRYYNDDLYFYDIIHIRGRHYVYDPTANEWTALPVTDPKAGARGHWVGSSGFYDPKLNAHFYFNARDSRRKPGHIWAWRYKKPANQ
ncbi:MAG: hypothetical protein ACOC70_02105 [bacterium]